MKNCWTEYILDIDEIRFLWTNLTIYLDSDD